jgi:integrase/recombinase XerD
MPAKLTTTITNIEKKVKNQVNRKLIEEFFHYLTSAIDTSENYQNGLLKVLIRYAEHLGPEVTFYQIQEKQQVLYHLAYIPKHLLANSSSCSDQIFLF